MSVGKWVVQRVVEMVATMEECSVVQSAVVLVVEMVATMAASKGEIWVVEMVG